MNNYIVLDGMKYTTSSLDWVETEVSPRQVKRLLSGLGDVTFGAASYQVWRGTMNVDAVTDPNKSGFGTKATLETAFRKHTALTMQDHFGNSHSVAIAGLLEKRSFTAVWDSAENEFHVPLEITTL